MWDENVWYNFLVLLDLGENISYLANVLEVM